MIFDDPSGVYDRQHNTDDGERKIEVVDLCIGEGVVQK